MYKYIIVVPVIWVLFVVDFIKEKFCERKVGLNFIKLSKLLSEFRSSKLNSFCLSVFMTRIFFLISISNCSLDFLSI